MKPSLTMAYIGNAIEATKFAIENMESMIDSSLPPGPRTKKAREEWHHMEREDFDEWTDKLKRFKALHKKLLAIERTA
jgi:hypothetical protein